jgi:hypothetical protein
MNNIAGQLLALSGVVSAIGVLLTAIVTAYRFIKKWDKWREDKDAHDKENYKAILRLVIMTPEMPLSERIEAGDIYVNKLNGNGGVKQKYNELLARFAEEHKE